LTLADLRSGLKFVLRAQRIFSRERKLSAYFIDFHSKKGFYS